METRKWDWTVARSAAQQFSVLTFGPGGAMDNLDSVVGDVSGVSWGRDSGVVSAFLAEGFAGGGTVELRLLPPVVELDAGDAVVGVVAGAGDTGSVNATLFDRPIPPEVVVDPLLTVVETTSSKTDDETL